MFPVSVAAQSEVCVECGGATLFVHESFGISVFTFLFCGSCREARGAHDT